MDLDRAAEWLDWYVRKYNGKILTNFDQQQPMFSNAPFSLQNIMSGNVRSYMLQEIHIEHAEIVTDHINTIHAETIDMTKISINLGDGAMVLGNVVAAKSIENSFNKVEGAQVSDELKKQLKELTKAIAKMSEQLSKEQAEQTARDLQTLTDEAISKSPRKEWWNLSIEGLIKAAKNVGEVGKPVIEIAASLIPLLTALSGG
jgi:hypothetical protein